MDVKQHDEVWFSQHGFKLRGKVLSVLRAQAVIEVTDVLSAPAHSGGWSIEVGEVVAVRLSELGAFKASLTEFQAFVAMLTRAKVAHRARVYTTNILHVVYIRIGSQWQAGFIFNVTDGTLAGIEAAIDKGEL